MHWSGAGETALNDGRMQKVNRKGDTVYKTKQRTGEGQGHVDILLQCAELPWQEYATRQRDKEENGRYCA